MKDNRSDFEEFFLFVF